MWDGPKQDAITHNDMKTSDYNNHDTLILSTVDSQFHQSTITKTTHFK